MADDGPYGSAVAWTATVYVTTATRRRPVTISCDASLTRVWGTATDAIAPVLTTAGWGGVEGVVLRGWGGVS